MELSSSSRQALQAKLASLRKNVIPLPAKSYLKILAPFLLHLAKQSSSSDRTQTIHHLMQEWYVKQPKIEDELTDVSKYPSAPYPGICFNCLFIWSGDGSYMSTHCLACTAVPKLTLYFLQDLLHYHYQIHPAWVELIFAEYVLKANRGYHGRFQPGL